MEYKLVPLATCPHLTNEVVSLLNSEWPRSTTMRRRSIDKALNMKPPMSLVMYYENELEPIKEIVVGHAKLCLIPCENESACWIESVIIKSNLRGKKLGLFLMNELEKFAINFNFDTMYLSTHDKKIFYEKCGFRICEPTMRSDLLGLTRVLSETHRACTYCGIEYKLSTSSYTIFKHCAKHAPFHPILMRHLGNKSFQNYLKMVPSDYVDGPPIDPDFEIKLKNNSFGQGPTDKELPQNMTPSQNLTDILKFGKVKDESNDSNNLVSLSNLFDSIKDSTNNLENNSKELSLKNENSNQNNCDNKSGEEEDSNNDDPLHDPMVEEILLNASELPNGFRKRLKTDNLKLTKLISVKHRICLSCNRRFMSSCGVTSLYKHCAKHPEFREILKKNLTPSALENAMKGARVISNRGCNYSSLNDKSSNDLEFSNINMSNVSSSIGNMSSDNLFSRLFNNPKNDEYSQNTTAQSDNNELLKNNDNSFYELLRTNLSTSQTDNDCVPRPCKRLRTERSTTNSPIGRSNESKEDVENLMKICLKFSKEESFPIYKFDSPFFQELFKYGRDPKSIPVINSSVLYNMKYNEIIDERIKSIHWFGTYGKVSISINKHVYKDREFAVLKLHYINEKLLTKTYTIGFMDINNDSINNIEKLSSNILNLLEKYKLNKSNVVGFLSDDENLSKGIAKLWNVPVIICLKKVFDNLLKWNDVDFPLSIKLLIRKASKLFTIFNVSLPQYLRAPTFFTLPKGEVFSYSKNWFGVYKIFEESKTKIEEINLFASEYCPSLILTDDEIIYLRYINDILDIFGKHAIKLKNGNEGIFNYIPIVQDLYDSINNFDLDNESKNLYDIDKLESLSSADVYVDDKEWFEVPKNSFVTGITGSKDDIQSYLFGVKERVKDFKGKVFNDPILLTGLYLNSMEVFRTKYGDETFWNDLGGKLDPEPFINMQKIGRVCMGGSSQSKGQKYHIFVTENDAFTVNEFWTLHKVSFKKLYEHLQMSFCFPSFDSNIKYLNDYIGAINNKEIDENQNIILVYKCSIN
uniref:N-acetyltransferase domain-containing protein n=1 Tax=Parastrongyloides trichosuri TaxID=131310 RepID=A0A0N4ZMB7_PARTI